MDRRLWIGGLLLIAGALLAAPLSAQEAPKEAPPKATPAKDGAPAEEPEPRVLKVVTKVVRPFAFKDEDGVWKGISIDVWRRIAEDLKIRFEFSEVTNTDEIIELVESRAADIGVAAITMKPDRALRVDFSKSIFESGLGIVTRTRPPSAFDAILGLFTWQFMQVIGTLTVTLFVVGFVVWLCERRVNPEQFEVEASKGLWSSFWWSAVTMTTVGYGDKSPQSKLGRLIALFWMFASLIMISTFTAAVASALTTQTLKSSVRGPQDLPYVRIGAKRNESPMALLRTRGLNPVPYESLDEGLEALNNEKIDAFVHDIPVMKYLLRQNPNWSERLSVLANPIRREEYGIAVIRPEDPNQRNKLLDAIDLELIEIKTTGEYSRIVREYLGE